MHGVSFGFSRICDFHAAMMLWIRTSSNLLRSETRREFRKSGSKVSAIFATNLRSRFCSKVSASSPFNMAGTMKYEPIFAENHMLRALFFATFATRLLIFAFVFVSIGHAQTPAPTRIESPAEDAPHYMGRTIAQTMHYTGADWLLRESRQREEDCDTMLRELHVRPGMTVCDMGCGNGFYALQMAELVGEQGTVLAVDIQPEMLRLLQARAAEAGHQNIEETLGTSSDPKLPPNKVDLILCVDVYHELSHPKEMLAAMRRALKPNGRLVLVEFRAEDPEVPIKPLHKMSKQQVLKELNANGFQLVREFNQLPWQHMMFFETRMATEDAPR